MRFRTVTVLAILALMIGSTPVARADIITEGVIASRCTEASDLKIPKKMEFLQTVMVRDFEARGSVALIVFGGFGDDGSTRNKGKIIASASLIKADETEIKLGKLKAKVKDGELERVKIVDANVAPGDLLHWKVKAKGLPMLSAELGECWELELLVGVADEIPD